MRCDEDATTTKSKHPYHRHHHQYACGSKINGCYAAMNTTRMPPLHTTSSGVVARFDSIQFEEKDLNRRRSEVVQNSDSKQQTTTTTTALSVVVFVVDWEKSITLSSYFGG